ncbi:hypothetical protein [Lachnobacterium bovis]|uniref:hypothetical protein n=1 Tax=Lachnobacterium bovis TaxID=140626 RepID=UPI00048D561A|nr:hypothetical protein [Lachnobacterium bovis]
MINKNFKKKVFGVVMTTALVLTNVIPTATVKAEAGATYPTYPTYYQGVDYSPVYEYDTYVKENVDVAMFCKGDKQKALKHFVEFGIKEDRVTSSTFDWKSYKNRYADLRSAFGNDRYSYYKHYLDYGINEGRNAKPQDPYVVIDPITKYNGRDYSRVYNYATYKEQPDLAKAFGDDDVALLKHFVEFGMKEGRVANETFDVVSYKNANADLRRAFGNDTESYYLHYIYNGFNENRKTSGQTDEITNPITTYNGVDYSLVYDANAYYKYEDLKKAIGLDEVGLLKHFVEFGMKEGREASPNFKVQQYKNNYVDLRGAFGNDLKKYYMHYIIFGHAEGRKADGPLSVPTTDNNSSGGGAGTDTQNP